MAFVLEAFFVEYSVDKSDLQTSLERKIGELELAVAQYVTMTTRTCHTSKMNTNTHTSETVVCSSYHRVNVVNLQHHN